MRLSGGGMELTVPGYNQKVNTVLNLEGKDLSGQSSSSTFVNSGSKPQRVSVATEIPMVDAGDLTALAQLSKNCDAAGNRITYKVDDKQANALDIRNVVFDGELRVSEIEGRRSWLVTFELVEIGSVAEKREERALANAAKNAPATDGEVTIGTTDPAKINTIIAGTK